MGKYGKYLSYLVRHIWYVRQACWKNDLYWQGLIHDLSKWRLDEFLPYARFFYSSKSPRDSTGYYKPTDTGNEAFEIAWLKHIHRNPHHWQHWIIPTDDGGIDIRRMPERYALEMLCDWFGASMAQGFGGKCRTWYESNKEKIQLHPETRRFVERRVADGNYFPIH